MAQYLGMLHHDHDLPKAEIIYQYKARKPLLKSEEEINNLPTKMRRLHQWYMKASKAGCEYIILQIKEEHYLRGDAQIHVEISELFQLYNLRDIDVSVISCYCL